MIHNILFFIKYKIYYYKRICLPNAYLGQKINNPRAPTTTMVTMVTMVTIPARGSAAHTHKTSDRHEGDDDQAFCKVTIHGDHTSQPEGTNNHHGDHTSYNRK